MNSAGRIEIKTWGLYPCWCEIYVDGVEIARLRHDELADMEFVIKRAKKEARKNLGRHANEV